MDVKDKKFHNKSAINSIAVLFFICVFVSFLLALTHFITNDKIESQNKITKINSCKTVLAQASDFIEQSLDSTNYYVGKDEADKLVGYAIISHAKGYGGKLEIITGITVDGTISGVVVLSQNETPGLGANCTKSDFLDQYKSNIPQNGFSVVKSSPRENEIQALTGATITSKAITQAVNDALRFYQQINK